MKKIILFLFAILLFSHSNATHINGCHLYLTCQGGNDYQVTFVIYRDCGGAALAQNYQVQLKCTSNSNFNFTATLPMVSINVVTPNCPAYPNHCQGGYTFGLSEGIYKGNVTLPPCNKWVVSFEGETRNVTNTVPSSIGTLYVEATLDNVNAPSNSNPIPIFSPQFIIPSDQTTVLNNYMIDNEGDSLVYSFVCPKYTSTTNVTYVGGYTYLNFLQNNPPGINFDPSNGNITLNPSTNITTVFAIQIDEYRTINGTPLKIGSVIKDQHLNIIATSGFQPILSGINSNAVQFNSNDTIYEMHVCTGDSVNFQLFGYDPDTTGADTMNIQLIKGIQGSNFQVFDQNTNHVSAKFSWFADTSNLNQEYEMIVKIRDNTCPYNFIKYYRYLLKVTSPIIVNLGADKTVLQGSSVLLNSGISQPMTDIQWYLDGNLLISNPLNTTYIISTSGLSPGNHEIVVVAYDTINYLCPGTDTMHLNVYTNIGINESQNQNKISIFPNPSNGNFKIKLNAAESTESLIEIQDITGKTIYQTHSKLEKGLNIIQISDLEEIEKGIYLLILNSKNQKITRKLIFL